MVKTAFAAVALIALGFSAPASAASMSCSSANLTKAGAMVDAMADGPDRQAAFHEIAAAQDDMLNGKMGGCARHIGKVMHMTPAKPAGM